MLTDEMSAESYFNKLQDGIARQYQEKGFDKEEAMKIGGAVAYDAGVKKYGKDGMAKLSREGRVKKKAKQSKNRNAISPSQKVFATESSNSLSNNSRVSDTMSNGLSNYQPMNSIIEQAPLGHGVAQDFGAEKKQGYNDRDDESIGMRHRGMHSQSMKSRRNESKGMEESMGNRPYSDVGTMDGRKDFEANYRVQDKNGNYWYKNSKTGANVRKLNTNRVEGNDKVRKAKKLDKKNPKWRMMGHVGDRGTKDMMADTYRTENPVSGATDMVAFTESPADLVMPQGDGNVIGQSTPTTDFTPLGARAESDVGTGFMYGAGATLGVMGAVIVSGFAIQGLQSLFGKN